MFTNKKEMTVLQRQFSAMLFSYALSLKSRSVIVLMLYIHAFVLLANISSLGTPQQQVECLLGKCWSAVPLSVMKWFSMKLQ
jgi:hypothetical protein